MKATKVQDIQEMGVKGDMLIGKREMGNMLAGDTTAGQNATEGIRHKSFSEIVIEEESEGVCGDSIVRQSAKGTTWGKTRGYDREGGKNIGSWQGRIPFSTRRY